MSFSPAAISSCSPASKTPFRRCCSRRWRQACRSSRPASEGFRRSRTNCSSLPATRKRSRTPSAAFWQTTSAGTQWARPHNDDHASVSRRPPGSRASNRSMKIVVIEFAGKGGMIHYVFQLCRAMAEAGADVTLITSKQFELASLPRNFDVQPVIDLWDPKANDAGPILRKLRRVTRAFRYYTEWLRVIRRVAALKPDVVQVGDIPFPFDLLPL